MPATWIQGIPWNILLVLSFPNPRYSRHPFGCAVSWPPAWKGQWSSPTTRPFCAWERRQFVHKRKVASKPQNVTETKMARSDSLAQKPWRQVRIFVQCKVPTFFWLQQQWHNRRSLPFNNTKSFEFQMLNSPNSPQTLDAQDIHQSLRTYSSKTLPRKLWFLTALVSWCYSTQLALNVWGAWCNNSYRMFCFPWLPDWSFLVVISQLLI